MKYLRFSVMDRARQVGTVVYEAYLPKFGLWTSHYTAGLSYSSRVNLCYEVLDISTTESALCGVQLKRPPCFEGTMTTMLQVIWHRLLSATISRSCFLNHMTLFS